MIFNSTRLQLQTLTYIGTYTIQTCGFNVHITAKPTQTTRWPCIRHCGATNHYPDHCPFRPNLSPEFTGLLLDDSLGQGQLLQPTQVSQNQPHARTSTALSATVLNASILTAVIIVGPITQELPQLRKVGLNPLVKPCPDMIIRPELELSKGVTLTKLLMSNLSMTYSTAVQLAITDCNLLTLQITYISSLKL